jgi:excisionase family DNA binding protein
MTRKCTESAVSERGGAALYLAFAGTSGHHSSVLDDATRAGYRLLEVSHVAQRLSVSDQFVRKLIRQKKLKAIRLGSIFRIDPDDLQAFINQLRDEDPPEEPATVLHAVPPLKDVS